MTRKDKTKVIAELQELFGKSDFFYLTDFSGLTVEESNNLRRLCFDKGVEMRVVKNTLAIKALETNTEDRDYSKLYSVLVGPTALMFTETANIPARIIKEFRKTNEKPLVKAAYIDTDVYIGDDQLEALASLKSKDELVGEIIGLLQSPAKNVISALNSAGNNLSGLLKAIEERG